MENFIFQKKKINFNFFFLKKTAGGRRSAGAPPLNHKLLRR